MSCWNRDRSTGLLHVVLALALLGYVDRAMAFAVLGNAFDAQGQPLADFGRRLWGIAPGAPDPNDNNRRHLVLKYWIASEPAKLNQIDPATGRAIPGAAKVDTKAFSSSDQDDIKRAIKTWNKAARDLTPAAGPNVLPFAGNSAYDIESTALHEIGHALGLHHPNQGGGPRSGLANYYATALQVQPHNPPFDFSIKPGKDRTPGTADDEFGADLRLQNFALANGPMKGAASITPSKVVQWTPGSVQEIEAADGKKSLKRVLPPEGVTEAVMTQGAFRAELQTELASDDIAGLRALQSGRDFYEGANPNNGDSSGNPIDDDFVFDIELAANMDAANIVFYNVGNLSRGVGQTTALGADNRSGPVQVLLDSAFDSDALLAATEVWPGYQGLDIAAVDIFIDIGAHQIDEPSTMSLLVLCVATMIGAARRRCGRALEHLPLSGHGRPTGGLLSEPGAAALHCLTLSQDSGPFSNRTTGMMEAPKRVAACCRASRGARVALAFLAGAAVGSANAGLVTSSAALDLSLTFKADGIGPTHNEHLEMERTQADNASVKISNVPGQVSLESKDGMYVFSIAGLSSKTTMTGDEPVEGAGGRVRWDAFLRLVNTSQVPKTLSLTAAWKPNLSSSTDISPEDDILTPEGAASYYINVYLMADDNDQLGKEPPGWDGRKQHGVHLGDAPYTTPGTDDFTVPLAADGDKSSRLLWIEAYTSAGSRIPEPPSGLLAMFGAVLAASSRLLFAREAGSGIRHRAKSEPQPDAENAVSSCRA